MFKASAKKTALLKCCIKEDVSRQGEANCYLVSLCETRFVERHVSIPALVAEAGGPGFFQGGPFFQEGPWGSLNYAFISTIIPLHECI